MTIKTKFLNSLRAKQIPLLLVGVIMRSKGAFLVNRSKADRAVEWTGRCVVICQQVNVEPFFGRELLGTLHAVTLLMRSGVLDHSVAIFELLAASVALVVVACLQHRHSSKGRLEIRACGDLFDDRLLDTTPLSARPNVFNRLNEGEAFLAILELGFLLNEHFFGMRFVVQTSNVSLNFFALELEFVVLFEIDGTGLADSG